MKIIITIILTDLVTNSLLSSLCPFLQTKNKNQVFSKLLVRYREIFLFFVYSESRYTSKPCRIQQTFIKEFSAYYSCSYYSSMIKPVRLALTLGSHLKVSLQGPTLASHPRVPPQGTTLGFHLRVPLQGPNLESYIKIPP